VTLPQSGCKKWNVVSDWIAPDWNLLRPIIEKSSEAYAKDIPPREFPKQFWVLNRSGAELP
jgi:hypothetical protein